MLDRAWRLLDLEADDGATNLATDEAVANAVAAGQAPPTFRLYTWSEPCLALGSAQPAGDLDPVALAGEGPLVVRRLSGGTTVLHDRHHLGFSLALPSGHPLGPPDVIEAYRRLNLLVVDALEALGVRARLLSVAEARATPTDPLLRPACYGGLSPYEVVTERGKLVGSAQMRRRGVVLHEGGVLLRFDPAETSRWLAAATSEERTRRTQLLGEQVTDLRREGRPEISLAEVAGALVDALSPALGGPPIQGRLSDGERAAAFQLRTDTYLRDAWTLRR